MRVIGRERLDDFMKKHPEIKQRLLTWLNSVENAEWQSFHDIKSTHPKASVIGKDQHIVIFDIGKKYRIRALVNFDKGVVTVSKIGHHSDYDHWTY